MGLEEPGMFPVKFVFGLLLIVFIFFIMFQFSQSLLNSIQHIGDKITDFFSSLLPG